MHAEGEPKFDVANPIVAFKRSMAQRREALRHAFDEVKDHVSRAVDAIREDIACGRPVVPEIDYGDIRRGSVSEESRQAIRRTGCAVVRGVFPVSVASDWFAELGEYLEANHYGQREVEKRGLDNYFSALQAGKPQIFNVYWSKPQVTARQDPKLTETRAFLNRLWTFQGVFDPDQQCAYADRARRRQPGDKSFGLSPHMDAGTVLRPQIWGGDGLARQLGRRLPNHARIGEAWKLSTLPKHFSRVSAGPCCGESLADLRSLSRAELSGTTAAADEFP